MIRSIRILPFLTSGVTFLLFELTYRRPSNVLEVVVVIPFLFFGAIYLVFGSGLKTPSTRFNFLITPTLLVWSALAFSLLIESALLRHLLAILVLLFLILFFESLITYIWRHELYLGYSLENLSGYALTLTTFLATSVLVGFYVLLDLKAGLFVAGTALMFAALNWAFFWISKIPKEKAFLYAATLSLILVELTLTMAILPFHFMVAGALLTVLWYIAAVISRAHLIGVLTRKMVARHLALGGILLVVLLITAFS